MNAAKQQGSAAPAPVISWWLAALLGIAVGVTVSLIRTERYFFIIGAGILALVIVIVGLLTIRRRQRHPHLMASKASVRYTLWALLIIFMVGPAQVIFPADDPAELWLKSVLLSLGFTVAIRQVDRHQVAYSRQRD